MRKNKITVLVLLSGMVFLLSSCEYDPEAIIDPKIQKRIDSLTILQYNAIQDSLKQKCNDEKDKEVKVMADSIVRRSIQDLTKLKPR